MASNDEWRSAQKMLADLAQSVEAARRCEGPALAGACRAALTASERLHSQLLRAQMQSMTRCDPAKCDMSLTVRCGVCQWWSCDQCCDAGTMVCDLCVTDQLEQGSAAAAPKQPEERSDTKKRGADEAAGGAAAKKTKRDEDDEVIPDLDDPDVPAWVWDWHLQEGNITAEDRQRVAQHAEETGGNLCVKCGVDMGEDNPRQYCGKNVCLGLGFDTAHST